MRNVREEGLTKERKCECIHMGTFIYDDNIPSLEMYLPQYITRRREKKVNCYVNSLERESLIDLDEVSKIGIVVRVIVPTRITYICRGMTPRKFDPD